MVRLNIVVAAITLLPFCHVAMAEQAVPGLQGSQEMPASPWINFQFDYQHASNLPGHGLSHDQDLLSTDFSSEAVLEPSHRAQQYDAAFYYPVPSPGVNFGLGINIRLVNKVFAETENGQTQFRNFNEAIPMFYATALFDLPFRGLSAGIEGRHTELPTNGRFDYKAKLRYQWNDVLGFEGGWQHQQQAINNEASQLQEQEGIDSLYLDLRLNF